ncbi:MAG: alpha-2-macroglobulin, partial [Sphingomonas bacterium]|nr:alpha-2-macroglobulin [Sphingomonas bacterium]
MKLAVRVALLALALAPIAAFGDNSPHVVVATPGVGDGAIERFTVRFDQPMVALGDPRAPTPFDITCPVTGTGRWADQQTFVYEFATPLPGGTKCTFTTKAGIKSVSGYALADSQVFTVDSGGPMARAILPGENSDEIEEDQVFLVAANLPATAGSVAANAYCSVEGVGEKIPVDVLPADTAAKILGEMGTENNYQVSSFLDSGGMPNTLPASMTDRQKMLASVTALKCRRPLPPGHDMALVWSGKIASASGKPA